MERDFLGLNSMGSTAGMNLETQDHGFMGSSGMRWAFTNKVCGMPQFMPRKPTQEERSASGFQQSYLPVEAFDSTHKPFSGYPQKVFNLDRQGVHFTMPGYPIHSIGSHGIVTIGSHNMRSIAFPNNSVPVAMNNPFVKIHGAVAGQNSPTISTKQQPLGGIPVFPFMGPIAGTYAPRNISKPIPGKAQLTIFYGGMAYVYDEVPPEKAQALIFMAGNGSSMTANAVNPRPQVLQATIPKPRVADGVHAHQSHTASPCSGLSSSTSVASHSGIQSRSGSCYTDDLVARTPIRAFAPSTQPELPKAHTPIDSASGTHIPAEVPQARKASLARFLEKRKERMTNTNPYTKRTPESGFGSCGAGSADKSLTSSFTTQPWCVDALKMSMDGLG